jgi:hypothetical protein
MGKQTIRRVSQDFRNCLSPQSKADDVRGRNNKLVSIYPISPVADKPWTGGVNPVEVTLKLSLERLGLPAPQ